VTFAGPIVPQKSRNFCSSVRGSFAAEHNQNEVDLLPRWLQRRVSGTALPVLRLLTRPPQCQFKTVPLTSRCRLRAKHSIPSLAASAPRESIQRRSHLRQHQTRTSRHAFAFGIRP
jgi:hypothetical protein